MKERPKERPKASFDMDLICNPPSWEEDSRVARWERSGRAINPDGKKLPLTIDEVEEMMGDRRMP